MTSTHIGCLHCPFWGFHCCSYSEEGSKGVCRLVHHLKSLHLSTDERKCTIRKALESDWSLFMALEESLRMVKQWMCGMCMSFHAKSRACHHPDGMVRVTDEMWEARSHIMHIINPSRKDSVAIAAKEGMVLDARLLDEVLQVPIFTAKSISHSCRLAFSQTLKDALYQVVGDPGSVGPWVRLLLLPLCTLQVFKPQTRQDCRSGNRKSLQQRHILGCLAKWRETNGFAELVDGVLSESGQVGTGNGGEDFEEKDKKMVLTSNNAFVRLLMDISQQQ